MAVNNANSNGFEALPNDISRFKSFAIEGRLGVWKAVSIKPDNIWNARNNIMKLIINTENFFKIFHLLRNYYYIYGLEFKKFR